MLTEYDFITITETGRSASGKTKLWIVRNRRSGDALGSVRWFGRWRQYAFLPVVGTIYSAGCLADIEGFIREQMAERRAT